MPPRENETEAGPRTPVAIYTRVSTDNQVGGRFDSCESQAAICRDHIRRHAAEGWYEVASFTDAAYSGGSMDRPGIQALKRMIQAGEVKVVLIFKLERVSRNMDEWGPFRAFLHKHGCSLESATENISESEPEGRLKNNIMMSVAEFERLNTAKKTRLKMREQAKRGYWNGGMVPYGYSYDRNTQALQPHPVEGPLLQRIFSEAAGLRSLAEIANSLNAEGHRTKQREMQRRDGVTEVIGGRQFRGDALRLLIRNPIYRGFVKFEGQEFSGKHEPLVSADLWERANAALAIEVQDRMKPMPPTLALQQRDAHNHILKGLAWCGSCGRALVPNDSGKKSVSGKKYRYYTCSLVLKESQAPCAVGRMSADALERAVISLLGETAKHPVLIREMMDVSRSAIRKDSTQLRTEIERRKGVLADTDKQLTNCASAVAKGGIDVLGEALVRRATELRDQRRRLLVEQERDRRELAAATAMVLEEQTIQKNLERFGAVFQKLAPAEQKELVQLFIDRIEVRSSVKAARSTRAVTEIVTPSERQMEIRVKLRSAQLAQGLEERAQKQQPSERWTPQVGQLDLRARVDFTNAMRGEVAITAPFSQTVRLDARVRALPAKAREIEHPILKALRWQRLLESGAVPTRSALAAKEGLTPGAITRIMKLLDLAPEIQRALAAMRNPGEVWHFGYRPMERLGQLPVGEQLAKFSAMVAEYESLRIRPGASSFSDGESQQAPSQRIRFS